MKIEIESESSSLWSNLPDDITFLIMNRLHYVDQIFFRAVCKSWREVNIQGVKPVDKLPWMMALAHKSCYLYDPFHRRKYTIETNMSFCDTEVLASKHGWILFTHVWTDLIFFYNPFINQFIQLPQLSTKRMHSKATFRNSPDSSNCEIFVERIDYKRVLISTLMLGNTEGIEYSYDIEATLRGSNKYDINDEHRDRCLEMEYVRGVVYCSVSFEWGFRRVIAFHVAQKTWEIFSHPVREVSFSSSDNFVEDDDGNLLLVCYNLNYYYNLNNEMIFKLDRSRMEYWFQLQSFNNRTLFLDYSSVYINPVEHAATAELRDTVHCQNCFYSACPLISPIYDSHVFHSELRRFWVPPPQLR